MASKQKSKSRSKGKPSPKPAVKSPPPAVPPAGPQTVKEVLALQVTNFKECLRPNVNLFHSHGEAYATVKVEGHFETWPIRSQEFKTLLRYRWFIRAKTVTPIFILGIPVPMPRTIPKPVLNDMLDEAEATAQFEGDERQIFLLVAAHTDDVYIDLCDDQWRVIHITADSWMIEESSPVVRFIRKQGMLPLPVPVHDPNALQHLNEFVAHLEKDGRILCKGFLLGALNPEGPYPLQVVVGEQGTGKSTICEIAKLLIDPTKPLTAAMPHGKRDLAIAAANSWLQVYDNISKISPRCPTRFVNWRLPSDIKPESCIATLPK